MNSTTNNNRRRSFFRYLMALLYLLAGLNHFINPSPYLEIMPPWLPFHELLVLISGIAEITLALLLLPAATRRFAAWGIILLLVAVFPANIQMSINLYQQSTPRFWGSIVRLPLQLALIWWAAQYTKKQQAFVQPAAQQGAKTT